MCGRSKSQSEEALQLSTFSHLLQFFINFNQATLVFTAYTFGTLLAYTVRASNNSDDLDVQHIVIIAL